MEIHAQVSEVVANFDEASAVAYALGTVALLVMSLCLSLVLSWRNAVLVGVVYGGTILFWFGRTPLPDAAVISTSGHASLPAPSWVYWCALTMAIAIEFCILLGAPFFLVLPPRAGGLAPLWSPSTDDEPGRSIRTEGAAKAAAILPLFPTPKSHVDRVPVAELRW